MTVGMLIDEVNGLDEDDFLDVFGNVYEHSDWVAEAVLEARPFESFEVLAQKMEEVVGMVELKELLELLMCCAEIGGDESTDFSRNEQVEAGVGDLGGEEAELFRELLEGYRGLVGLPFIVRMGGMDRAGLLRALGERLLNAQAVEFQTAITEVHGIARERIGMIEANGVVRG